MLGVGAGLHELLDIAEARMFSMSHSDDDDDFAPPITGGVSNPAHSQDPNLGA